MSHPRLSSRFFRNAVANWGAFLYVAIVSFFLSPFVVQHLGGTAYGVWSLLVALVGYLGLLDFGVRGAVTRYVAHHHAVCDHKASSEVVSAGLVLFGFLGFLAIVLSGLGAYFLPYLFTVPDAMVGDAQLVLVLGGLTVATTLIGAVFGGVVTGLERFDISSGIEIIVTTIRTAAVVVALDSGHGLVMLGCIHLGAAFLYGLGSWVTARRIYPALRFDFGSGLPSNIKTILSFSAYLSLLHVFSLLSYYSNALIIAAFLPIAAVTFFAIAGNLVDYAGKVAGALSKMMTPRVSALTSAGSEHIGAAVTGAARVATLSTAPIAVTFWLRGESFVNLWMGNEYGPTSGDILRILALMVLLGGARAIASASIIGANKHRTLVPGLAFEAVANIALSIALVGPLGVVGVAWGVLVPSALISLFFIPRCLRSATGVPVGVYIRDAWVRPTLACVPFSVASFLVEHYFPAGNLLVFFAQVLGLLLLLPVGAWFACLSTEERRHVGARLRRMKGRGKRTS